MWYSTAAVTAPEAEPLTLEAAKRHLSIDASDDSFDALIGEDYLPAARAHVESITGSKLVEQVLSAQAASWADLARLPFGPVQSITSITYTDTAGDAQTLDAADYELWNDGMDAEVRASYGVTFPAIRAGSRITLTATVGYESPPAECLQAIRMLTAFWFMNREAAGATMSEVPHGVYDVLTNHRRF